MRKIYCYLKVLLVTLAVITACKEMDSTYREYVVPGGIIYTGKVVAPKVNPGRNRIRISWLKGTDPSVTKARIFWNNYMDSVEVAIPLDKDTVKVIIDNLPEEFYSFFIVTYDKAGNSSVPEEVLGTVYGENYQAGLLNRPVILGYLNRQGNVSIQWGNADLSNGAFAQDIIYTNVAGETITQRFNINESTSELLEYKPGTTFKYRTAFLPDIASLDTFYTSFTEKAVAMKIDKSNWTATADSYTPTSMLPSGPPHAAIDDNINTFWHSLYPSTTALYPHWVMVDMKVPVKVGCVELTYRQNVFNSFKEFMIQGSVNGVNWITYGTYTIQLINDPQIFIVPGSPSIQYLRIYASTGQNNYASIAEISVYGY